MLYKSYLFIPERHRLAFGLLISLSFHALLLSLTFSGQGVGLPGLGLPWQDRRIEAPELRDLNATLTPLPARAPQLSQRVDKTQEIGDVPPIAVEPAMLTLVDRAPPLPTPEPTSPLTPAAKVPQAKPKRAAKSTKTTATATTVVSVSEAASVPVESDIPTETAVATEKPVAVPEPAREPAREIASEAAPEITAKSTPSAAQPPPDSVPPLIPNPDVMALAQSKQATWSVPPVVDDSAKERALEQSKREVERELAREDAKRQADRQETQRQEVERQQAEQRASAQQDATRQIAARQEALRQAAAQQEVARAETVRLEAQRKEAARQEGARQALAKADATRMEGERQEAAQQAAAAQEAARQDNARQAVAGAEAARVEAKRAEEAQREERLKAIGRQLNEEADRRELAQKAAAEASRRDPSASTLRRGRLFGRADPNAELVLYAEAWSRKIELNMTFDMIRDAARLPHTDPLVTVAVRSDGSVESVVFVRSSGVAAIDAAIRRIVQAQANYPAFPPGLLRDYDVVEIRRTWHFDIAIRLY